MIVVPPPDKPMKLTVAFGARSFSARLGSTGSMVVDI